MANCSFIKATDARTRARNDTLIWTEICELQAAILAAIDGTPCTTPPVPGAYSTIVNDDTPFTETQTISAVTITDGGTLYDVTTATGLTDTLNSIVYTNGIAANGTNGSGAFITPVVTNGVITSFTVNNSGSNYTPVSATASVDTAFDLTTAQDETSYTDRFAEGDEYFAGETITLSESSTVLVDNLASTTGYVTIATQDETNYDGGLNNGTIASAGSGYVIGEVLTMNDGTVITVDAAPAGAVTEFTVTTSSTASFLSATTTLTQDSTDTNGIGFAIATDTNNVTAVGPVSEFTVTSGGIVPFFLGQSLTQASTDGIGTGFSITPISPTNATAIAHGGNVAILTPIVTSGVVTAIVVNNGGTSYSAGQPVTISHPTTGAGATAAVNTVDGSGTIQTVTVTTGGSGYETATALVAVDHPTGSTFEGTVNLGDVNLSNDYTSGLAFDSGADTITRVDGTGFVTDGLENGMTITISNAEDAANDATYTISNVTETVITVAESIAVTNADDVAALISKPDGVTSISIQDGGFGYADVYPTVTIDDPGTPAGSGASISITSVTSGVIDGVSVDDGGTGYSSGTTLTVVPVDNDLDGDNAVLTPTIETNTFGTSPTEIYSVWSGQATDAVISDQIQYVLDYFTALGYNIRAQVNPATANTLQWQIIW